MDVDNDDDESGDTEVVGTSGETKWSIATERFNATEDVEVTRPPVDVDAAKVEVDARILSLGCAEIAVEGWVIAILSIPRLVDHSEEHDISVVFTPSFTSSSKLGSLDGGLCLPHDIASAVMGDGDAGCIPGRVGVGSDIDSTSGNGLIGTGVIAIAVDVVEFWPGIAGKGL